MIKLLKFLLKYRHFKKQLIFLEIWGSIYRRKHGVWVFDMVNEEIKELEKRWIRMYEDNRRNLE